MPDRVKAIGIVILLIAVPLLLVYVAAGLILSDRYINGFVGIHGVLTMKVTGTQSVKVSDSPPVYLISESFDDFLGHTADSHEILYSGYDAHATINGEYFHIFEGQFTSHYGRVVCMTEDDWEENQREELAKALEHQTKSSQSMEQSTVLSQSESAAGSNNNTRVSGSR